MLLSEGGVGILLCCLWPPGDGLHVGGGGSVTISHGLHRVNIIHMLTDHEGNSVRLSPPPQGTLINPKSIYFPGASPEGNRLILGYQRARGGKQTYAGARIRPVNMCFITHHAY